MKMESTVQNNEKRLKKLPWLHDQIKDTNLEEGTLRVKKAKKTDHPILEKLIGDRWISLYSKFNPIEESEMWANSVKETPNNIVLFGFGLGYHFDCLSKRFPKARFHIIEPDAQLFMHYINVKEIPDHFFTSVENFMISDQTDDYKAFFASIMHFIDDNWLFVSLPKFERAYSGIFAEYTEAFLECKKNYTDEMVSQQSFEKIWNFNVLQNFPQLFQSPSIFDYRGKFEGKTALLTASGPSLNEAFPFIQQVKENNNAIIVAAGTSINGLLNKGIKPDLFVSYDPFLANYEALKSILDEKIPFVFGSTIYPAIPAEYGGPKAYLTTTQDKILRYACPELNEIPVIKDAPTITGVALDLLHRLGVKSVYLAGQDLCYINNKTGAEGVYVQNKEGKASEVDLKKQVYVENNNGEQSLTSPSFLKMKKSIEDIVGKMNGSMSIYSMSLSGAKIEGIPYRSIHQSQVDLKEESVESIHFRDKEINEDEMNAALINISREISSFTEIKDALSRQLQRFQSATPNQREKWRNKIDHSLDRLTHHSGYKEIIYPTVTNRISYMVRLKNNADFNDEAQVQNYFEAGVRPLVDELSRVLDEYQMILDGYQINNTSSKQTLTQM